MEGFDFSQFGKGNTPVSAQINTTANVPVSVEKKVVAEQVVATNREGTNIPYRQVTNTGEINNLDDFFKLDPKVMDIRILDTLKAIGEIESELNNQYVERENEIHMIALALVSGVNAFLHGLAGTGKSALVEDFTRRIIRSKYFRILMGKTTEPGEVFGPVSINAMKNDSYKVSTRGKLPEANIAFVDEVFKSNSAVLNSLLTIMNEKIFFNDGVQEVPLISMIGASNEYIEDDSLIALYDRFLLRWHVDYIKEEGNRMKLFQNFLTGRKGKSRFQATALTADVATIDIVDLLAINEKVKEVDISTKVLKVYNALFVTLSKLGINVSDRRKNESLKVIQAQALLDGRDYVDTADFEALKYTLWSDQKDIQAINDELVKMANPNITKYNQFKKSFDGYKTTLENIEKDNQSTEYAFYKSITLTETNKSLKFAVGVIQELIPTLKTGSKEHQKFSELLNEMTVFLDEVRRQIVA